MSIVSEAKSFLEGKSSCGHKELIEEICQRTGRSYESVRGTLIKRGGVLGNGWSMKDGRLIPSDSSEGYTVDYDDKNKKQNWQNVKAFLPESIEEMVTLAGEEGHCIEALGPNRVISYDYDESVLQSLLEKFPDTEAYCGDIWQHNEKTQVFNADLMGYMCGSLYENLKLCNEVGHDYIVLTIQKQVKGFRNSGRWKNWAVKKFKNRKDKNLASIKHALKDYDLLKNLFYKREGKTRAMRTCVLRRKK